MDEAGRGAEALVTEIGNASAVHCDLTDAQSLNAGIGSVRNIGTMVFASGVAIGPAVRQQD